MDQDYDRRYDASDEESALDIGQLIGILRRRFWLIAGVSALMLVPGLWYTFDATPTYEAAATIFVTAEDPEVTRFGADFMPETSRDRRAFMPAQIALITSDAILGRVVDGFAGADDELSAERSWTSRLGLTSPAAPPSPLQQRQQRIAGLARSLEVRALGGNSVIEVKMVSTNAGTAAFLANAISDTFVSYKAEQRREASRSAISWLNQKVAEQRDRVRRSEQEMLKIANELGGAPVSTPDTRPEVSPYAQLTVDLQQAELELLSTTQRLAELRAKVEPEEASEPEEVDEELESLVAQLIAAKQTLHAMRLQYTESHPELLRQQAVVAALEEEIGGRALVEEVEDPGRQALLDRISALEEDRSRLQAQVRVTRKAIGDLTARESGSAGLKADYKRLEFELNIDRQMLDVVMTRLNQMMLTAATGSSQAQILDYAVPSTKPMGPNRIKRLVLVAGLAGCMGLGCGVLRELADKGVYDPKVAADILRAPFLGPIPVAETGSVPERQSLGAPSSPGAESYRHLRTSLMFTAGPELNSLVVTSGIAGEGKTTVSVNLAATFGATGRKVLLIDADLRRPRLDKLLSFDRSPGLSEVLQGDCSVSDAIRSSELFDFDVITSGETPRNPAELLASPRFDLVLARTTAEYELVLVDSPVLLAVTDALLLTSRAQGVLLVHKPGSIPSEGLMRMKSELERASSRLYGFVFNQVLARDHYSYGTYLQSPYVDEKRRWASFRRKRRGTA